MLSSPEWAELFERLLIQITDGVLKQALWLAATSNGSPIPKLTHGTMGWVVVPDELKGVRIPSMELRVLLRDRHHLPAIVSTLSPSGPRLGQELLESMLLIQLPARLPTPFVGRMELGVWAKVERPEPRPPKPAPEPKYHPKAPPRSKSKRHLGPQHLWGTGWNVRVAWDWDEVQDQRRAGEYMRGKR